MRASSARMLVSRRALTALTRRAIRRHCLPQVAERAVSSVGRASPLHGEGRRFEPVTAHQSPGPTFSRRQCGRVAAGKDLPGFCARFKDRVFVDGGMAQAAFREGRVLCPLQIAEMSLAVLGENVLGGHGACRSAGAEKQHSEDNVRHRLCSSLGSRA